MTLPTIEVLENATQQVRIYPSDYQKLKEKARIRRTTIAQIIHESFAEKV